MSKKILIRQTEIPTKEYVDEEINALDSKINDVIEVDAIYDGTKEKYYITKEDADTIIERYDNNQLLKIYVNISDENIAAYGKAEAKITKHESSDGNYHEMIYEWWAGSIFSANLERDDDEDDKIYFYDIITESTHNKIWDMANPFPVYGYPTATAVKNFVNSSLTVNANYDNNRGKHVILANDVNKILDKIETNNRFDLFVKYASNDVDNNFTSPAHINKFTTSGEDYIAIAFSTVETATTNEKTFEGELVYNHDCYLEEIEFEQTDNKVTSLSAQSTDIQYPSAKAVWDTIKSCSLELNRFQSFATSSAFVFGSSKPGIYMKNDNGGALKFEKLYYKKNSDSEAQTLSYVNAIAIVYFKDINSITNPNSTRFAYLIGTSYYDDDTNGNLLIMDFSLNSSGNIVVNGPYAYNTNLKFITPENQRFSKGKKQFDILPEVTSYIAPSNNTQFTPKKYVDDSISTALASIDITKREIVQQLPTQDISTKTIYMVERDDPETQNIYDEYMYINNEWEKIGSTEVDLSNYYTKTEIDAMLGDIETILDDILDGALDAEDNEY